MSHELNKDFMIGNCIRIGRLTDSMKLAVTEIIIRGAEATQGRMPYANISSQQVFFKVKDFHTWPFEGDNTGSVTVSSRL